MKCPECGKETVTRNGGGRLVCSNAECESNLASKAWPPKTEAKTPRPEGRK